MQLALMLARPDRATNLRSGTCSKQLAGSEFRGLAAEVLAAKLKRSHLNCETGAAAGFVFLSI